MSAGIVDDLELIQIEIAEHVVVLLLLGEQFGHQRLEGSPIEEPCQIVMGRLVAELFRKLSGQTNVLKHHHGTKSQAAPRTNRGSAVLNGHAFAAMVQ
ncbi:hypothetical protein DK37_17345 [Halomonas sp. SUBG004]|nr:hypothetical protein DK37_17345 [Halomonas sp. SUBG004]